MRKRDVKAELLKYPCYIYENGRLRRIDAPTNWHGYHLHHYITTQWEQNNPEKFKEIDHLQKLIFLPPQMHMELHAKHSKFKKKYGLEIGELLFNGRAEEMISAKEARAKSEVNNIKNLKADIEKEILKSIEKGNTYVTKIGKIPEVIQEELKAAGYTIEVKPTGVTRILW